MNEFSDIIEYQITCNDERMELNKRMVGIIGTEAVAGVFGADIGDFSLHSGAL